MKSSSLILHYIIMNKVVCFLAEDPCCEEFIKWIQQLHTFIKIRGRGIIVASVGTCGWFPVELTQLHCCTSKDSCNLFVSFVTLLSQPPSYTLEMPTILGYRMLCFIKQKNNSFYWCFPDDFIKKLIQCILVGIVTGHGNLKSFVKSVVIVHLILAKLVAKYGEGCQISQLLRTFPAKTHEQFGFS